MERNWLIRTSQNQILGPVAKAKVLEFLQKGALGLNDEVASGNGYWFSLKEKDLVEKYLYGDVPQGYNPISESKSVLSKRDNPDKTTSLNTAPANKTQVLKPGSLAPGVLPKNDDLEYPDMTIVSHTLSPQAAVAALEEMKLPTNDDLEFPDIGLITASINSNPHATVETGGPQGHSPVAAQNILAAVSNDPVIYPEDDDLAYPDMGSPGTPVIVAPLEEIEEDRDFTVAINPHAKAKLETSAELSTGEKTSEKLVEKKASKEEFKNDFAAGSGLSLDHSHASEHKEHKEPKAEPALTMVKKERPQSDEKKLFHERKVKSSTAKEGSPRETTKDLPKEVQERVMPEHLKKRNDNYLMYVLVILVLIILSLFFYYYRNILNKPLPV